MQYWNIYYSSVKTELKSTSRRINASLVPFEQRWDSTSNLSTCHRRMRSLLRASEISAQGTWTSWSSSSVQLWGLATLTLASYRSTSSAGSVERNTSVKVISQSTTTSICPSRAEGGSRRKKTPSLRLHRTWWTSKLASRHNHARNQMMMAWQIVKVATLLK